MKYMPAIGITAFFVAVTIGTATASAQTYPYAAYCPFNKTIAGVESALDVSATRGNCASMPNPAFSIIGNTGNPMAFCYSTARITPNSVCVYVSSTYNRVCPNNERYLNSAKTAAQCAAAGGTLSSLVAPDPTMKICRIPASSNALVCAYYDHFMPLSACMNGIIDRPATIAACVALPDAFFDTVSQTCRMERAVPTTAICRYLPQTITCPNFPLGMMEINPVASSARCAAAGGISSASNGPPPAASCSIRGNQNILMLCAYRPVIRPITPPPMPPAMPRPITPPQSMPVFPITPYNTPNICMKRIGSGAQTQLLNEAQAQATCAAASGTFTQNSTSIQCVAGAGLIPNLCVYDRYVLYCAPNPYITPSQFTTLCTGAGGAPDTSTPVWTCTRNTGNLPMSICGF